MSRTRRRNGEVELRTPLGWKTRKQAPQRWDTYDAEQNEKARSRRDRDHAKRIHNQDRAGRQRGAT